MSTVYPIASRRPQPDLLAHPAALAWSRLCPDSDGPSGISILKQRSKSVIYRMDDAAPDGSAVIAKLCRRQVAAHERIVYDQVLSKIPVSHPRYFGSIEENSECDWLFLEYIEGEPYSRGNGWGACILWARVLPPHVNCLIVGLDIFWPI